ncbi:HU domain-containing protein [Hymenobacter properus]|uniref:SPOR domain-containing protein n=1 Tax=Hymenobacter properus TaxID=2791026 RepID=A0A931BAR5_9BACT|nr:SPOR domain-containing protein [Hymenobacter properus]MBF9140304.1 SPOR domain-containing protein [Hymenobacter properus]MBR7719111.1 SPOR domain-containing protein [Microvirga sp. SRT04]
MHLADHIRPLLRDHDCVIIPDFGGLVADASPARAQPGRQALSPPTKLVAFNQALTRNDGLLVDALSQHLGMPISQAREAVRAAVAGLKKELDETNRTELPGIGIFRRAAGRGLAFEYTGTDNLLASAFGLPELVARPVRAASARDKRPQPVLRGAGARRTRLARLLPGSIIAVAASLLILANYQFLQNRGYVASRWQVQLPKVEWQPSSSATVSATEPQQATLAQHSFGDNSLPTEGMTPVETSAATTSATSVAPVATLPEAPATEASATEGPANATPAPVVATDSKAGSKAEAPAASKLAEKTATSPAPKVEPVATTPAAPVAKAPAAPATTIKYRTGRYYVIAAAYTTLANAEKGRKNLAHAGHKARIILPPPGSRLFRLTAGDYADLPSAQREAQRLRISTHCDYNTLKF